MTAKEDQYTKEQSQRAYLMNVKQYVSCMSCGNLIAPNDYGYDISMCKACQDEAMKD